MSEFCRSLTGVSFIAVGLVSLGGCGHFDADAFDIRAVASHLPPYQTPVDQPRTLIDRALDQCPDKTEERETLCVKKALLDNDVSVSAVVAMVPHCRLGRFCSYHHKTVDRLGYLSSMAEEFSARWRVDFDLVHAPKTVADLKTTVALEE